MIIPIQYPDVLSYERVTGGGSHYDEYGNLIIDPLVTELIYLRCRAEANSKGAYLSGIDGNRIEFDWVVDMPLPFESIAVGVAIQIAREGVLRAKGNVKRSISNQIKERIWV